MDPLIGLINLAHELGRLLWDVAGLHQILDRLRPLYDLSCDVWRPILESGGGGQISNPFSDNYDLGHASEQPPMWCRRSVPNPKLLPLLYDMACGL